MKNYSSQSIVSSLLRCQDKVSHVIADKVEQPKTKWTTFHPAKVWKSDDGMVITNESNNWYGIPHREFYIFKNENDYNSGTLSGSATNLGKAKLLAESL